MNIKTNVFLFILLSLATTTSCAKSDKVKPVTLEVHITIEESTEKVK